MLCLCPLNTKGGGHTVFGAHPVCVASFPCINFSYLMDFDQTCIDALLVGGGEEYIKFWRPWPTFQGHCCTLKCPK